MGQMYRQITLLTFVIRFVLSNNIKCKRKGLKPNKHLSSMALYEVITLIILSFWSEKHLPFNIFPLFLA